MWDSHVHIYKCKCEDVIKLETGCEDTQFKRKYVRMWECETHILKLTYVCENVRLTSSHLQMWVWKYDTHMFRFTNVSVRMWYSHVHICKCECEDVRSLETGCEDTQCKRKYMKM